MKRGEEKREERERSEREESKFLLEVSAIQQREREEPTKKTNFSYTLILCTQRDRLK